MWNLILTTHKRNYQKQSQHDQNPHALEIPDGVLIGNRWFDSKMDVW